jgi:hypothetical protein
VVTGENNSPTAAHACWKRRLKYLPGTWGYWWATLPPGVVITVGWPARLGVGNVAPDKADLEKLIEGSKVCTGL